MHPQTKFYLGLEKLKETNPNKAAELKRRYQSLSRNEKVKFLAALEKTVKKKSLFSRKKSDD